ncbi:BCCT family transporter [Roseomonas genomospecies 6]|uniref:BCCT family transporter n=1 Tax=Roseomonas genomospecies 6 TaxID=214106 RepID=A0A9W7TX15_9PROT|nr:BCCT family transporter [Roseomonas genomospecies 6]KAA0679742.1 BCCT family transporter [Roseomonas genomospecies 6]
MSGINKTVSFTAGGLILLFVVLAATFTESFGARVSALQATIVGNFGWFYILTVAGFLLFSLWLFFSPYGSIKLGKDGEEPEFSYPSWFAMLFSAGMGIGLLFYGVAEPILHFSNPRVGEAGTPDAAREAMNLAFLHWGLHAWGIYIVVGLSLGYFAYRHDLPLTIRSALYPLLGDRLRGWPGHLVDIVAIFGTLFGIATSLGLGVMQINAGLDYLGLVGVGTVQQMVLIAVITAIATVSAVSGVGRGIRRLSELNMLAGLLLLLFVFLLGPSVFLLSTLVESIGRYLWTLPYTSFRTLPYAGAEWQASWTMFYWGWWISWAPFVGMFIARVSRGRTIREFVGGVLFAPVAMTFVWFIVFGETAIHMEMFEGGGMADAVRSSVPTALFVMLDRLPLSGVTSAIATLMVITFFVTSADSGALVIDIIGSGGNQDPPIATRIFWAVLSGVVAALLLLVGGLQALQTAAVTTALPFAVVMVLMCVGLVTSLRAERRMGPDRRVARVATPAAGGAPAEPVGDGDWRQRLAAMVGRKAAIAVAAPPGAAGARRQVARFIAETVEPAFRDIAAELERLGRRAELDVGPFNAGLVVLRDGEEEFSYDIRARAYHPLTFAFPEMQAGDERWQMRVEVILRGGLHKQLPPDRTGREAIVHDFVQEYGKWMGW